MGTHSHDTCKVSLFGVSRNALLLGRACALKDNPILGVYDPDPQRALRAALFLGVSASHSCEALFKENPDVVLCSLPAPDTASEALLIHLGPRGDTPIQANFCWADTGDSDRSFPERISNELPHLEISLEGSEPAVQRAREFFQALSGNIACRS